VRGHTWSRSARLAGRSQARGLPSSRCPSVRGHTWSRSARLAGRSQARGLPSSRCPSVRGHTWSRSARLAGRSQARGLPSSRCPSVRGHTWSRSAQPCQRTPSQPTRARRTAVFRFKHVKTKPGIRGAVWTWHTRPALADGRVLINSAGRFRNWLLRSPCRRAAGFDRPSPNGEVFVAKWGTLSNEQALARKAWMRQFPAC